MHAWETIIGIQTLLNCWALTSKHRLAPLWCLCTEIHWTVFILATEQYGLFAMNLPLLLSWLNMLYQWNKRKE